MSNDVTVPALPAPRGRARVDGRSAAARRYRALVAAFSADLEAPIGEAERQLVSQAAIVALRAEQMRADILRGAVVPNDDVVRLSNAASRLLATLRPKRKRESKLSLAEHLAKIKRPS